MSPRFGDYPLLREGDFRFGLVVAVWVDGVLGEDLAGGWLRDDGVAVVDQDEDEDLGAFVASSDREVVEAALVAERDGA